MILEHIEVQSIDVAGHIHRDVTRENLRLFYKRYAIADTDKTRSESFRRAMILFRSLPPDQQKTFFEVIRQVSVDTASTALGIIEGTTSAVGLDGEFSLLYDGLEIGRSIQTDFLVIEEEADDEQVDLNSMA